MILGDEHGLYGSTSNGTLLESVPLGLATSTVPVVAPAGTVVEIAVPVELTVNVAAMPLNVTPVAPVRSVPKILTVAPTLPEAVCVFTNRPQTHGQAEDRAAALRAAGGIGAARGRCPIEVSTGGLHDACPG